MHHPCNETHALNRDIKPHHLVPRGVANGHSGLAAHTQLSSAPLVSPPCQGKIQKHHCVRALQSQSLIQQGMWPWQRVYQTDTWRAHATTDIGGYLIQPLGFQPMDKASRAQRLLLHLSVCWARRSHWCQLCVALNSKSTLDLPKSRWVNNYKAFNHSRESQINDWMSRLTGSRGRSHQRCETPYDG